MDRRASRIAHRKWISISESEIAAKVTKVPMSAKKGRAERQGRDVSCEVPAGVSAGSVDRQDPNVTVATTPTQVCVVVRLVHEHADFCRKYGRTNLDNSGRFLEHGRLRVQGHRRPHL